MMTPQPPPPPPYGGFGAPGPGAPTPGPQYGQYPAPPPAPRPSAGLKVLAVVQILFGVFGVVAAPLSAVVANLQLSKDPLQEKLHDVLWEGPAAAWSYGSIFLGLATSILLVATGVGLWRGKLWARKTGLVYGAGSLVILVVGQLVMILLVYPMLLEQMDAAANPVSRAGAMGGMVGGLFGALFGAILPIVTLVVLGRASVKAQLD